MKRTFTITLDAAELPETVTGFITARKEDSYIIMLNNRKTKEEQAAAFLHECLHIYHDDLNNNRPADEIEKERHRELLFLLETMKGAI